MIEMEIDEILTEDVSDVDEITTPSSNKDRMKWVLSHIMAMKYAHTKVENMRGALPMGFKLDDAGIGKLKQIIRRQNEILAWYIGEVEYHRKKIISHLQKMKTVQNMANFQTKATASLERKLCRKNPDDFPDSGFCRASELPKRHDTE